MTKEELREFLVKLSIKQDDAYEQAYSGLGWGNGSEYLTELDEMRVMIDEKLEELNP